MFTFQPITYSALFKICFSILLLVEISVMLLCAYVQGRKPNDLNLNMGWVPSGSRNSSGMALGFLSGWFKLPKLKCEATMDPLGADESLLKKKYKNKISVQTYLHPSPLRGSQRNILGIFNLTHFLKCTTNITSCGANPRPGNQTQVTSSRSEIEVPSS